MKMSQAKERPEIIDGREEIKGINAVSDSYTNKLDRLSIRSRPANSPLMKHNWGKLLFMHWPISSELLRPLIPKELTIDNFGGSAWIGITPFTLWGVRLSFAPLIHWLSAFHELNVRTYVHRDGVPGVWFLSLDANSIINVFGARTFFHLPYVVARIELEQKEKTITYDLRRRDKVSPADFIARWIIGDALPESMPDSLEFFLTERYCLYSFDGEHLYRGRIHHKPWPLRQAELLYYRSTMIESHGLPKPQGKPLIHYAEALEVDVWPLEKV